ncbi:hypothetical protein MMC25_002577 [Agyrium rufum]|nr:hypothetical protein [Agyrium rufum]
MALYQQELVLSEEPLVRVTYIDPDSREGSSIDIPLRPSTNTLKQVDINLHDSPTKAYDMGERYNGWFSERFGYEVMLAYLGPHLRPVLGNLAPSSEPTSRSESSNGSWLNRIANQLPSLGTGPVSTHLKETEEYGLTFADIAAYLVVTEESLANVSGRLSDGLEADMSKFRPNIVVSGSPAAWDEDYWAGLAVHSSDGTAKVQLSLTQNCGRCVSVNVDYESGKPAEGELGNVLKKMMKDRRIDPGNKYSPIFGRYGFLEPGSQGEGIKIAVGDEVVASKRNSERTVIHWPGLGSQN